MYIHDYLQLGLFRGLRSYSDNETRPNDEFQGTIRANCRPIQPLGWGGYHTNII